MALTSVIRYVSFLDSTLTTGAGKTGLAFGDVTAKYLVDGGTLTSLTTETITTLGTYQAPTSSAHLRIKELSSSDPAKGVYEVHFHDTQLATGTKLWLLLSATGAVPVRFELDLTNISGRLPAALTADGNIKADTLRVSGTTQTARDLGASVLLSSGTGTGQVKLSSGYVAPNWGDVGNPTTTVALTGTTIAVTQKVDVETIKTNPVVNGGTVTFPINATLASTTNITAGTLTTVTTATNVTTVNGLAAGVITATSIADDAITAAKIADGAIDSATFAGGATIPRCTLVDTLTTYTGNTVQTGDAFARIGVAGVGLTNIVLPSGGLTNVTAWTVAITGNITGNLIGTVSTLTTYTGNTPQTGDTYALANGASGFAAIKVDTAAIKVTTDKFVFTVTNKVDANAQLFGGQTVTAAAGVTVGAFVGNATAAISVDSSGRVKIQSGVTKNAALANFDFPMYDDTDHSTPLTGLTVVAERSIDGAAFGACANSAVEIGTTGIYVIDLDATDLNGTTIMFRFSATGADDTMIEFVPTL